MKKISIILIGMFLLSTNISAQDLIDAKTASKIAKENVKALKKVGVKKVMFMEFFGTFITSKETSPSTMNQRWGSAKSGTSQGFEVSHDYYETVTNEMFELVKKVFTDNGIEVLDKETLINTQEYIDLGLKQEKKVKGYSGGVTKKSVTTHGIKRSVTGMGMYSETMKIGAIVKINKMFPKIAKDNNCEAGIAVKFDFGLGKKNVPVLNSLNITMSHTIDLMGKGKRASYYFKKTGIPIFTTKKAVSGDYNLMKKGEMELKVYNKMMVDLIKQMTGAYSYLLKNE